jgi:putative membrane protein
VRVETAGGSATGRASAEREWVAPIIGLDALRPFIATILPEADLDALEWMRVAPRAIRRRRVVAAATSLVIGALAAPFLGLKWAAAVIAILLVLGLVNAQLYVASLGWAKTDRVVAFKSGWFHRSTIIVPLAKIQAVELDESPFDRRHSMASLSVDTAGAGGHSIDIPYLSRPIAEETRTILAHEAASTVFRW